ncbi:MAG TPA: nitroreductase family protein [Actinomycetota bacterium]|nr:nitroreductase family protein [Actinomycetota bacterium]
MELTEVVGRRRMVRNYAPDPIPRETVERILRTARKAPSAGFSQGQVFLVVTNEPGRAEVARLAGEAERVSRGFDPWLSRAPVHVVVCVDHDAYARRYARPDKPSGGPATWPVPYAFVDAGASLMLLLLAAVDEGLAAGLQGVHNIAGLKEAFGIPESVDPIGVVTIGRPAPDRRSSSLAAGWKPLEEVVHWEKW